MTTTEVFGRPVEGDIHPGSSRADQADPAEFIAALDAVLAHEGAEYVQWDQYTPYFNDGDECVFSAQMEYSGGLRLSFADNENHEYDNGLWDSFRRWEYQTGYVTTETVNGHDVRQIAADLSVFRNALESGAHDDFLKKSFGDHATVQARKDGFSVDFYDHD